MDVGGATRLVDAKKLGVRPENFICSGAIIADPACFLFGRCIIDEEAQHKEGIEWCGVKLKGRFKESLGRHLYII